MAVVECHVCEQTNKTEFYCQACIKERVLVHHRALDRLAYAHSQTTSRAHAVLSAPDGPCSWSRKDLRSERSDVVALTAQVEHEAARLKGRVQELEGEVEKRRRAASERRERLKTAKAHLHRLRSDDRRSLADPLVPSPATLAFPASQLDSDSPPALRKRIASQLKDWDKVLKDLVDRRRVLIAELLHAFPITRALVVVPSPPSSVASSRSGTSDVTSERSSSSKTTSAFSTFSALSGRSSDASSKTKGKASSTTAGSPKKAIGASKPTPPGKEELELRILGLALLPATASSLHRKPLLLPFTGYGPDHLSAAASHAAHFVRLVAIYLGVKLPFQLVLGPRPGIKPISGSVWAAKFPAKKHPYPLFLPPADPVDPFLPRSSRRTSRTSLSSREPAFLTGLSMLSWSCLYLLTTQISPPPAPASGSSTGGSGGIAGSEVSSTWWAQLVPRANDSPLAYLLKVLASRELGYRSHVTGSHRASELPLSPSSSTKAAGAASTSPFGSLPRPENASIPGADLAVWVDQALAVEDPDESESDGKKTKDKELEDDEGWSLL